MDPDAALEEIRRLLASHDAQPVLGIDVDRLVELVGGLDEWLSGGGFLPWPWRDSQLPGEPWKAKVARDKGLGIGSVLAEPPRRDWGRDVDPDGPVPGKDWSV